MVNLLEKYRPTTLDDIYGQKFIVDKMKAYIRDIKSGDGDGNFPHFLLSGPPGTGKTTLVYCALRDALGKDFRLNLLEKNASNVLIKDLREEILDFATRMPIGEYQGEDGNWYNIPFNVIFLDEVDKLSRDSQALLRRTMETCAIDTRFILACNYPNKLIDAIKSRCTRFYFKPLSPKSLAKLMKKIADNEQWEVTEGALELIANNVKGDARHAVSIVEMGAKTGLVDEEEVKRCLPIIMEKFNTDALALAISANGKDGHAYMRDFKIIESNLDKLFYDEGKSAQQILISIFESVEAEEEMPINLKRVLLENIFDCNVAIHQVDDPLFAMKTWLRSLKL